MFSRSATRLATRGMKPIIGQALFGPEGSGFQRQHPWLFRWPPLLFTLFWFADNATSVPRGGWIGFAIFFAIFLLAYLRVFWPGERYPRVWLGVLFLLGYVYFPFNRHAAGEFVFPVVMCVYFLRQAKLSVSLTQFAAIELIAGSGFFLEARLVHARHDLATEVIFYMVAIGFTNFAYSRHLLASEQLERANTEIEHLAQVAERERIARDLHDLLGHTLTVIVLKADVANRLFTLDPELAHREIAEVERTARGALAEVREAVAGYRAEGLTAEVSRARRTLSSAGVQLTTDVDSVSLAPAEANVLCILLREAVTNVIRHAGATACRLELHREGHCLRLTLEDNGNGRPGTEGNGLRGMRERLASAGGNFARVSGENGGTRLIAEIPVGGSANNEASEKPREEAIQEASTAPVSSTGKPLPLAPNPGMVRT